MDINPQPHYPFEFYRADAMTFPLEGFDAIHASAPCQKYTWAAKRWDRPRVDLVAATRERLVAAGKPWVIENVIGAPLIRPVMLCGQMFGLGVIRHRLFECSGDWLTWVPDHPPCSGLVQRGLASTVAGHGGQTMKGRGSLAQKQRDMGIDWMTLEELNQAIPPAFTEYIGRQLLAAIQ